MQPFSQKMKSHKTSIAIIAVFMIMLLIGINNYTNYGISVDERACRTRALINVDYITDLIGLNDLITEPLPTLDTYKDKDHGVIFDLVALGFEWIFNIKGYKDIFIFKHLLNYLVFWLSLIALYFMAKRRFKSQKYGLVAILFMFLSPRFFADAFYNAKDLIFMAFILMAMNSATTFLSRPTWLRAVLLAFFSALAIATRAMGIVLLPAVWLIVFFKGYRDKSSRRALIIHTIIFTISTGALTVLFWPTLWADPINNFLGAFSNLSQFTRWEKDILLFGDFYPANNLPWFFIPGWIIVTTPLLYLVFFFTGLLTHFKRFIFDFKLKFWHDDNTIQDLFFLLLFVGPILSVHIFNSILYDGWRHLYFVYPAFLMIALYGLQTVFQAISRVRIRTKSTQPQTSNTTSIARIPKAALIALIVFSLTSTAIWMYHANPLQNVYFNALAGNNWRANYDLDYWGLANREALEQIVETETASNIYIASISASSIERSFKIIESKDRDRLELIEYEQINNQTFAHDHQPVYVFNNYKRLETPDILDQDPRFELYYRKIVDQEIILTVYKLREKSYIHGSGVKSHPTD
ncbi:MAG: glycosyltransferase family 39 protein [Eubacteriales bacterium]|nr:glycosyltransferase family 39 protein [Eubacteriales bacterium]